MPLAKAVTATVCFLLGLILAVPAQAFFPETETLAERLADRVGQVHSLQVTVRFSEAPRLRLSLWQQGERWRQEWVLHAESGARVAAAALGRGDALLGAYPERRQFPLPVFAFWYQSPPQAWWAGLGIDTEVKSYQFVEGQPCLVLGARYKEWHTPQIWVHNEDLHPVRLFTRRGMIWHWKDYRSVGNHPVPHRLELTFPDGRMVDLELEWNGINREIPDRLLNPSAFAEKFGRAGWSAPELPLFDFLLANLPAAERSAAGSGG